MRKLDTENREWDGKIGPSWGGEAGNRVKGVGCSTYELMAHISSQSIFEPTTIESRGERMETARDGKSIADAWERLRPVAT